MYDDGMLSLLSLAALGVKDKSENTNASIASLDTTPTVDSAIGDSLGSKRSSLDRKSQSSSAEWIIDLELRCPCTCERNDDETNIDEVQKSAQSKRHVFLSSISLPRKLLSRCKDARTSTSMDGRSTFGGNNPLRFFTSDRQEKPVTTVASTTGLILEARPSNLPAKSEEEEARHRALYLDMIEQTKKKEARRARERKRKADLKRQAEDQTAAACKEWNDNILPNWENAKTTKHCRELWWRGIPPKVRGRVWSYVIGNELNLSEELYEICCARAQELMVSNKMNGSHCREEMNDKAVAKSSVMTVVEGTSEATNINRECTVELVHLDVSRTFPSLGIFQKGGPYYDLLFKLLGAYVCYRPDIGYVQSMSFVAAVLLLQMESYDAFIAFSNLLNRPLQLAFFRLRQPEMTVYFIAYDQYFEQELPRLHTHFDQLDVRPDLYLIEWVYTLYAKSLPLDVTCRVWDVFFRDGEEFLFKTALGILHLYEHELMEMEFDEVVQFLTHIPETITSEELFSSIEPFMRPYPSSSPETTKGRRRFMRIYDDVLERITAGGSKKCLTLDRYTNYVESERNSSSELTISPQLCQLNASVRNMKMSKSLSGFLGDLLKPPSLT